MWSLYKGKELTSPIVYSSGKSQEDVVMEILEKLDDTNIIFFKGSVGSGKSAVALHVIKYFSGSGAIVVPTKSLEMQYYTDYYIGKFTIPELDVHVLMGKSNYQCKLLKTYCGNKDCPCSRPLKKKERRSEVASECKYWSPVLPNNIAHSVKRLLEEKHGISVKLNEYTSIRGRYYHVVPEEPCEYYKLFSAYTNKNDHVIVFNLAKWEIETWIGRKPKLSVEIIDEGDYFLDNLAYKVSFSKKKFESMKRRGTIDKKIIESIEKEYNSLLFKHPKYDDKINTSIKDFIEFVNDTLSGISTDGAICEMCNKLKLMIHHENYVWVRINKKRMTVYLPRPDITLNELMKRCGKIVLMSGTFQSDNVIKHIYSIHNSKEVYGENRFPGKLIIKITGKEMKVNKELWEKNSFRRKYFDILNYMIKMSSKPCLVHVHAYKYVPDGIDVNKRNNELWWSTTSSRGIDLPDNSCRSIIILKYPYPDLSDPVLRTMKNTLGDKFWYYYRDIANRTIIQQVGRGLRHKNDWVEVWSPDKQVISFLINNWNGEKVVDNKGGLSK